MNKKRLLLGNVLAIAILFGYIMLLQRYLSGILRNLYESISVTTSSPVIASVGIIGGSDGPTAIFISGSIGDNPLLYLLVPLILVGMILMANVVFLYRFRN